jgi:hypothetical protein
MRRALQIDPDDFKAKRILKECGLGQRQLSTLFTPVKQEREEEDSVLLNYPMGE